MAIQDPDPERRNLVVISIAFIAYFYAGGCFPESSVRLQVINANFSKPEILGYIAWCAFCWFIYRYWLTHRGSFVTGFSNDFNEWHTKHYITEYVNNYFDQQMRPNVTVPEYHAAGIGWKSWHVVITCNFARISRDREGNVRSIGRVSGKDDKPVEYIKLTNTKEWLLAIRASAGCILKKPSFSNYVVPYILAITALFGALHW
jgi:hypothetical protein